MLRPCPGKCLPTGIRPSASRAPTKATPHAATTSGSCPKARSPMTVQPGSVRQSSTGVSPESKPAARSSRAIARPTAAASAGSPARPTTAAAGKRVNGSGRRWTRPPSWSTSTRRSGSRRRAAAVRLSTVSRSGQFRVKRITPPRPPAAARASRSSGSRVPSKPRASRAPGPVSRVLQPARRRPAGRPPGSGASSRRAAADRGRPGPWRGGRSSPSPRARRPSRCPRRAPSGRPP